MSDEIFKTKEKTSDRISLDEITQGDLFNLTNKIEIPQEWLKILDSKYGLFILNKESKVIRIVKADSDQIYKIVIYLKDPVSFVREVIKFYKNYSITLVSTTGICFRGKNLEDCIYEAYVDLSKAQEEINAAKIIEIIQGFEGVEKIFVSPLKLKNKKKIKL
ncbi:MAG: hypothetical protein ACTSU2_10020 [Promethearchaeota archaeon]